MVIPLPAGAMGAGGPLDGPPPPEVRPRFQIIKYCLFMMMVALMLRLMAGVLMGRVYAMLMSSFNLILNTVIGIFLLNDDEHMAPIYNFMMDTCCQSCRDQCRGGMSCLMTFILCNLITVVMDVLLNRTIEMILKGFEVVFTYGVGASSTKVAFFLYLVSVTVAFIAQAVGSWQGWKAHQEAQSVGTSVVPGVWGGSPTGGGGGGGGGWNDWGGGRLGAAGGRNNPDQVEMQDSAPAAVGAGGRPSPNFQAFTGVGNRLGE